MEYICCECEDPCMLTIAMKADIKPILCPWKEPLVKWEEKADINVINQKDFTCTCCGKVSLDSEACCR